MNPGQRLLQSLNCDGKRAVALLLACTALCLPCALGQDAREALRYERSAVAAGQWWRLVTGHVVHLDLTHALLNATGLALLWALFGHCRPVWQWLLVVGLSVIAIDAGFWFLEPQLQWYVGASGVLHGVMAAGTWSLLQRRDRIGWGAAAALIGKLVWERWSGPLPLPVHGPVVSIAHLYGALGGGFAALLLAGTRGWHNAPPHKQGIA